MKTLFSLVLLTLLPLTVPAASGDYFSTADYYKIHPEEQAKEIVFSEVVRSPANPVDRSLREKPVVVACIFPGEQISDYWRRSIAAFEGRMKELHIPYVLHTFFSRPGVDTRKQQEQLRETLELNPDYLVFTLDVHKHISLIDRLTAREKPKLILQNITTPLKRWEGKQPMLYVGFDHQEGTQLIADYYLSKFDANKLYGLLFFSQGYISEMRGNTFIRYTELMHGPRLAAAYYTNGNREKAMDAAVKILDAYPVNFLYATSTDVALGAVDALKKTGKLGTVQVNGWGGGSAELDALMNGELDVTVMRMNDDNGVAMAEAIRLDIEGETENIPTIYSGDMVLIRKGVDNDTIQMLKTRAFRYSDR